MLWNELETNLANIDEDIIIENAVSIDMDLEGGDVEITATYPAGKIGTVWRFKKSEIENWVNAKLSTDTLKKNEEEIQIKNIMNKKIKPL